MIRVVPPHPEIGSEANTNILPVNDGKSSSGSSTPPDNGFSNLERLSSIDSVPSTDDSADLLTFLSKVEDGDVRRENEEVIPASENIQSKIAEIENLPSRISSSHERRRNRPAGFTTRRTTTEAPQSFEEEVEKNEDDTEITANVEANVPEISEIVRPESSEAIRRPNQRRRRPGTRRQNFRTRNNQQNNPIVSSRENLPRPTRRPDSRRPIVMTPLPEFESFKEASIEAEEDAIPAVRPATIIRRRPTSDSRPTLASKIESFLNEREPTNTQEDTIVSKEQESPVSNLAQPITIPERVLPIQDKTVQENMQDNEGSTKVGQDEQIKMERHEPVNNEKHFEHREQQPQNNDQRHEINTHEEIESRPSDITVPVVEPRHPIPNNFATNSEVYSAPRPENYEPQQDTHVAEIENRRQQENYEIRPENFDPSPKDFIARPESFHPNPEDYAPTPENYQSQGIDYAEINQPSYYNNQQYQQYYEAKANPQDYYYTFDGPKEEPRQDQEGGLEPDNEEYDYEHSDNRRNFEVPENAPPFNYQLASNSYDQQYGEQQHYAVPQEYYQREQYHHPEVVRPYQHPQPDNRNIQVPVSHYQEHRSQAQQYYNEAPRYSQQTQQQNPVYEGNVYEYAFGRPNYSSQ